MDFYQLLFVWIFLCSSSEVFAESIDCSCGKNAKDYDSDDDSTTCQCECLEKYEGNPMVACTPIPDPCLAKPCGLAANCKGYENGTRSCECPGYYKGNPEVSCEPKPNPCNHKSCGPDSSPVPSNDYTKTVPVKIEKKIS